MKKRNLTVCLMAVMLMVISVFTVGCGDVENGSSALNGTVAELKAITVTVVLADESEKVYNIETDAEFLGEAMFEKGLITESEYKSGFYTEINGVKADYSVDKSWWCITKGGEMTTVGMNEQPIAEGDSFEITYTVG